MTQPARDQRTTPAAPTEEECVRTFYMVYVNYHVERCLREAAEKNRSTKPPPK